MSVASIPLPLKSIKPKMLILNGDIIDIWQFSKNYWPETHMKVVRRILKFVTEGIPVYYLTGNHDEMLRKFADFDLGSFQLLNKLVLNIDGKKAWIFHGDVFDPPSSVGNNPRAVDSSLVSPPEILLF